MALLGRAEFVLVRRSTGFQGKHTTGDERHETNSRKKGVSAGDDRPSKVFRRVLQVD
jgi:hypothetical protein